MEAEGERTVALELPGEVWAEITAFLSTPDLLRLASSNSHLRSLALSQLRTHRATHHHLHTSRRHMTAVLTFLRVHCPRITRLDLSQWEDVDDRLLKLAFSSNSSARKNYLAPVRGELAVHRDNEDDERSAEEGGFGLLQELNLESTLVSDRSFSLLPRSITSINLNGLGKNLTNRGLMRLVKRCPDLVTLHMSGSCVTNSGLQCLPSTLRELGISFAQVCCKYAEFIQDDRQFALGPAHRSFATTGRVSVPIPLPQHLQVLNLAGLEGPSLITSQLIRDLCACPHLRVLHIGSRSWTHMISSPQELPYTHEWMKLTSLRELSFANIHVTTNQSLWFLPDGLLSLSFFGQIRYYISAVLFFPSSLTSLHLPAIYGQEAWMLGVKRRLPNLKRFTVAQPQYHARELYQLQQKGIDVGAEVKALPFMPARTEDVTNSEDEESLLLRENDLDWQNELAHPTRRRLEDDTEEVQQLEPLPEMAEEDEQETDEVEDEEEDEEEEEEGILGFGF